MSEGKLPFRLPHNLSRWVWGIDLDQDRCIIEVRVAQFNGKYWDITTKCLPQFSSRDLGKATVPLEVFWDRVTPIGGRVEDLSNPISEEQYGKGKPC